MIVRGPVDVKYLLVRDLRGIEIDLNGLGVIADTVIRWVLGRSARVANARANDARQNPKLGFGMPESAERESSGFDFRGRLLINRRHFTAIGRGFLAASRDPR